jgi:predicted RNA-binding protein Jag
MKEFTSKTVEDAVNDASKELGIPADQLVYKVTEEKKGSLLQESHHRSL